MRSLQGWQYRFTVRYCIFLQRVIPLKNLLIIVQSIVFHSYSYQTIVQVPDAKFFQQESKDFVRILQDGKFLSGYRFFQQALFRIYELQSIDTSLFYFSFCSRQYTYLNSNKSSNTTQLKTVLFMWQILLLETQSCISVCIKGVWKRRGLGVSNPRLFSSQNYPTSRNCTSMLVMQQIQLERYLFQNIRYKSYGFTKKVWYLVIGVDARKLGKFQYTVPRDTSFISVKKEHIFTNQGEGNAMIVDQNQIGYQFQYVIVAMTIMKSL
eukprot:TRINITY_DN16767_c0_g1_i2.p1 TRINITY_DN16767_c0_g1~~TRINITY_DN16767_c0_g1_i2.p1  ORF type:complete len:266 (-),score=-9.89 TRINITY_DN16767_c0_g1_i2:1093-1890(-)